VANWDGSGSLVGFERRVSASQADGHRFPPQQTFIKDFVAMKRKRKETTIFDVIEGMTPVDAMNVLNQHPTEKDSVITLWKRFIDGDDMPDEIRNMSDGQHLRRLLTLLHTNVIGIKQYKKGDEYSVIVEFKDPQKWNDKDEERMREFRKNFIEL
jgi:hypothetical protein